ncbi:MAG TPA: ABC transporter ATP-binding protein [Anaerolineae bacterium]|nr:ABC transporter ATP-binding protein [Anaerolineae bacterium]
MTLAIETTQLIKTFTKPARWWRRHPQQEPTAVNGINLAIPHGELFGLLGPNGAGKTTLVKMLCTLILPTSGHLAVAGHTLDQAAAIRAAIGLVPADERSLYWRLTGRQNLQFFAVLYGLRGAAINQRVDEVLDAVNLLGQANRPFSHFSTGMKQRLAIARGLLHRPQILFLDEPTRSLDPVATESLHQLLLQLQAEQNITIFLITHDLNEAEKLCHRVAVMHKGDILALDHPNNLRQKLQTHLQYAIRTNHLTPHQQTKLQQIHAPTTFDTIQNNHIIHFEASETDQTLTNILDYLRQQQYPIHSIHGAPPTLEKVFQQLTRETTP